MAEVYSIYDDFVAPQGIEPKEEAETIIVTARLKNIQHASVASGSGGSSFNSNVLNFSIQVQPIVANENYTQGALQTTATALSGVASSIEAVLKAAEAAGAPIPRGEKARLAALAETLHVASTGLKTGAIDQSSAHKMVATAFAVAWDVGGAAVVGISIAAIAAVATAFAGAGLPPHIKALTAMGAGAMGILLEVTLGNSGLYEALGKATADALFWAGAKVSQVGDALSNLLSQIVEAATSAMNPFNNQPYRDLDLSSYDVIPGQDDIDGVAVEFSNYAGLEPVAPEMLSVHTAFYRSAGGPPWTVDEPISGYAMGHGLVNNEPLFLDQPIG